MTPGIIIPSVFAALAYLVSGLAGQTLAVPPANVTVIWPAAGVALALTVIYGPRILPGLFLGSFIIQSLSFLDSSSTDKIMYSALVGAVIAAGSIGQAWIGAKLVRPILKHDRALLTGKSIVWFCLLAGPVSCLVSATVGVSTLWFSGILTGIDLPLVWSTWWVGDATGVLIFGPIVLCFFARPRNLWRTRITSVALPLFILITIAFVAFRFSYQQEMQIIQRSFEKSSIEFKNELLSSINLHAEAAKNLKEYFDSSTDVSPVDFPRFVRPKLNRHPEIMALEWIPVVHHKDRADFERRIGSHIKIPAQSGGMKISPTREFYYPIEYLEPFAGNEKALGFDIRNNPLALKAAEAACESGKTAVTEAIRLVQDSTVRAGIVFYAPVYEKDLAETASQNCDDLLGFTASVFKLESQIEDIHEKFPWLSISVSRPKSQQILYRDASVAEDAYSIPSYYEFSLAYQVSVANQVWQISFLPGLGFISHHSSWAIWLIIIGGLFISGISGIGLLMLTGRTLQTENQIKHRTAELNKEIRERKTFASLLAVEKSCLEMVANNSNLNRILDVLTGYIEQQIAGSQASILLLDSDGKHLNHGSAPSLPPEYSSVIDGVEIGPKAGSCGTAAFLNKRITVSDIASDPLWEDYRNLAAEFDLKACFSLPITVANGKVLGTFALYFKKTGPPSTKAIDLTSRMANIAAIAILRRQTEEQLNFDASHDALTGLVNRREFERRATQLLEIAKRTEGEHALCYMDLDQFKVINDSYGHTAGDEMLRQITRALQKVVRKQDTLSRLGGDEFGALLEHCSLEQAHRVVMSLQQVIQDFQFTWEGQSCRVGVSIGLVAITNAIPNLSELMKQADAACYMAKDLGRNRIHVYHPDDSEIALRHGEMQWVTRLNSALEDDSFCLYAQKIEPLDDGNEMHYELLIRMQNENGDIVPPGAFLPAAERYNLIAKVDHWVIRNAFDLMAKIPPSIQTDHVIGINLSGQSLADQKVLEYITSRLQETGIEARNLCFEITETAAILNMAMATQFISTLKQLGCQFALDDFGSGLSSFGYLKNLPVDYLKIDGMFVKDIVDDPIDYAMVKSINEIGQIMGMKTIAEFVENDEVKNLLSEIGVNYAQGYGIEKPRPFHEVIDNMST